MNKMFSLSTKKVLLGIGLSLVLFLILGIHLSKPVYADPTNATYCPSGWFEAGVILGVPNYCCEPGSSYYTDGGNDVCKKGAVNTWGLTPPIGTTIIGGHFCPDDTLSTCPGIAAGYAKCWAKEDLVDGTCGSNSSADGKYFLGCTKTDAGELQIPVVKKVEKYLGSGDYEQKDESFGFCYDGDSGSARYSDSLIVCACNDLSAPVVDADFLNGNNPSGLTFTCKEYCEVGMDSTVLYNGVDNSGGPGPGNFQVLACEDPKTNQDDPECKECFRKGNVWTSVGCIDTSQNGIILWVIRFAIGLIIAIAIVRFIQASLMLQKADPESVQEGREMITSAVIALVLALISIPLLSFVGVKVLNIFPEGFL